MYDAEVLEAEEQLYNMDIHDFVDYLYRVGNEHAESGNHLTATDYRIAARRICRLLDSNAALRRQ
jgi:hypothetical protein